MVKDMNGDKAPGRLSSKHVWDVFKVDVVKVFLDFHEHGKFESLNATFITLIPKKVGFVDVKDFRLITLVSGALGHKF